jgi:hypothetical protein
MRRSSAAAILWLLAGAIPVRAADDLHPAHKPGLWEIDRDGNTAQYCIDAEVEQLQEKIDPAPPCSRQDVQRSGDTVTIDRTCKNRVGGTVTDHTVITGSADSAYTLKQTLRIEGGGGWTLTISGKWLGPCTEGQRPGDVIVNGVKAFNILEYAERYQGYRRSVSEQDAPPPAK